MTRACGSLVEARTGFSFFFFLRRCSAASCCLCCSILAAVASRRLQTPQPILRDRLPTRLSATAPQAGILLDLRPQVLDRLLGHLMQFGKPLLSPKRLLPRRRPHPNAVHRNRLAIDQTRLDQTRNRARQQIVQKRPHLGPKVRQRVVVHAHTAAQPPVRRFALAQTIQKPRAAYPVHRPIQPQSQQERWINRRPATRPNRRLHILVQRPKVQTFDVVPNLPRHVIRTKQVVHAAFVPLLLKPLRCLQPQLRRPALRHLALATILSN